MVCLTGISLQGLGLPWELEKTIMAESTQQRNDSSANQSASERADTAPTGTDGGTATAVKTRPAPPSRKVDQLPPWRVLLHNDDVNDIGHVVESIIELLRVNPRQALLCTLTAHRTGLCHLISTHREHAELLQDQFKCKWLTVTIEPER